MDFLALFNPGKPSKMSVVSIKRPKCTHFAISGYPCFSPALVCKMANNKGGDKSMFLYNLPTVSPEMRKTRRGKNPEGGEAWISADKLGRVSWSFQTSGTYAVFSRSSTVSSRSSWCPELQINSLAKNTSKIIRFSPMVQIHKSQMASNWSSQHWHSFCFWWHSMCERRREMSSTLFIISLQRSPSIGIDCNIECYVEK